MDTPLAATAERAGYVTRRRFTAAEYNRMGEVGILHEDDPWNNRSVNTSAVA